MNKEIVLITGANRGLGRASALQLAQLGYHALLGGRRADELEALKRDIETSGGSADAYQLDVTHDEDIKKLRDAIQKRYAKLDCLINNAGMAQGGDTSSLDVSEDNILTTFQTNTLGPLKLIQNLSALLAQSSNPRAINISSGMGALTDMEGGYLAYRISKAGLNVITLVLHNELHASQGIRVNSVCPGWVRTNMGGPNATRSLEEGIKGIIWAVQTPKNGPSGKFFRDGKEIPW